MEREHKFCCKFRCNGPFGPFWYSVLVEREGASFPEAVKEAMTVAEVAIPIGSHVVAVESAELIDAVVDPAGNHRVINSE